MYAFPLINFQFVFLILLNHAGRREAVKRRWSGESRVKLSERYEMFIDVGMKCMRTRSIGHCQSGSCAQSSAEKCEKIETFIVRTSTDRESFTGNKKISRTRLFRRSLVRGSAASRGIKGLVFREETAVMKFTKLSSGFVLHPICDRGRVHGVSARSRI